MGLFTELFAWWTGNTIGTRLYTWRKGARVGSDSFGNIYYEERGGPRRWVIYRELAEPSLVPPAWHGWLHHTVDVPPNEEDYDPRRWQQAPLPNLTGTALAYRPPGSTLNQSGGEPPPLDYEPWRPNPRS
jgi:NADH:ubiquinone oxidoreductase subunit